MQQTIVICNKAKYCKSSTSNKINTFQFISVKHRHLLYCSYKSSTCQHYEARPATKTRFLCHKCLSALLNLGKAVQIVEILSPVVNLIQSGLMFHHNPNPSGYRQHSSSAGMFIKDLLYFKTNFISFWLDSGIGVNDQLCSVSVLFIAQ